MSVLLELSIGDIVIDLYCDERPRCCYNFLKLCKAKYYNFCLFYEVQKNFLAMTGDPDGTGKGGHSIYPKLEGSFGEYFPVELQPKIRHRKLGTVAMLNPDTNSHGSQFYITLAADKDHLDGKHSVFGEVVEGFDILEQFNNWYCDRQHKPLKDIRIFHTIVLHDPFPDPEELEFPPTSPLPTEEMLRSDGIGVDDVMDETEGFTQEEIEEYIAEKEARANAQILEIIGDLPSFDVKPSDSVLFVCKLNSVTTSEDLEIIFSRFGEIRSCEVITDQKTAASLQYAFIDFANIEACEQAYLKMENTLIDDRRIHVDFSQSVAEEWWKYKSEGKTSFRNPRREAAPKQVAGRRERSSKNFDFVFSQRSNSDSGQSTTSSRRGRASQRSVRGKRGRSGSSSGKDIDRSHRRRVSPYRSHQRSGRTSRSPPYPYHKPTKSSPRRSTRPPTGHSKQLEKSSKHSATRENRSSPHARARDDRRNSHRRSSSRDRRIRLPSNHHSSSTRSKRSRSKSRDRRRY